jgi:hypothetical protein
VEKENIFKPSDAQNYWIFLTREYNVLETGAVSILR